MELALKKLRLLMGEKAIITDPQALQTAAQATFGTSQKIQMIWRPAAREQVQWCVKVAHQHKIPLYPVSGGKNWGFGSSVPVQDQCVLLDLSRVNQITAYDEKLAYVTVEPGVTFRQIYQFLKGEKSALMLSIPGTSPDASVIGNALERGHGLGPYADRFAYVCGLEVVLPNGEIIHTGFGRFPHARTTPLARWGVGPMLDGLFSQSNLGIITQMTVWLSPIPKYLQLCYMGLNDSARFPALVDALQQLKLEGVIAQTPILWNDLKQLAIVQQYPWAKTAETPLPLPILDNLKKLHEVYTWQGWIGMGAASAQIGEAERLLLGERLAEWTDLLFFLDENEAYTVKGNPGKKVRQYQGVIKQGPFVGEPVANTMGSIYWRKTKSRPAQMHLDRDGCGLISLALAIPFTGADAEKATSLISRTVQAACFEPHISLIGITEREIDLAIFIVYDREVAGEDDRAMACYHTLQTHLDQAGYVLNRLGIQAMDSLPPAQDDYIKTIQRLKQAFDPHDILAPGRYDFRGQWSE
jgi:4-cresol dehydrogenase (hydroxylating)